MSETFGRADFLRVLLSEGQTPEEVCRLMSMDPMQVRLIAMSGNDPPLPFSDRLKRAAKGEP